MTQLVAVEEYVAESPLTRLNWGCGSHVAAGWINSDVKDETGVDLVADIRRGLPLQADSVDYAVSVHALPELPYPELVPTLAELRRVLKPDGVLRLVLPDLDRAIDAYRGGELDYFQVSGEDARSASGRFIRHVLWFGYSRSLFTHEFAEELLTDAGFERVHACAYRRTRGPFGRIVELDNRPEESFYLEARKPRTAPEVRFHLPYNFGVAADELEIVDVAPEPGEAIKGHFRVLKGDGRKVQIVGWVLGEAEPATEVEVVADGTVAGRTPVAVERPDVVEHYPDIAEAATCGFEIELVGGGRGESQLEVFAVLKDDSREPLGRIVVRAEKRGLLGALRRG
jgi:predicted SAM-dependent methyltransferase